MKIITFIGFGAFGQAVAKVLSVKQDLQIRAWDVQSTGQDCQVDDVKEAVADADVVFFAVPSQFFADCVKRIEGVPENAILISGTKGMDPNTNKFPFEILKEQFIGNPIAVLSGPMLAGELNAGAQTSATIASDDIEIALRTQKLFSGTQVELLPSTDVLGTSALGVLKNIYVLALGLSDGLELGADFKQALFEKAQDEMQMILTKLGANPNSVDTPAGIGDFRATGYSTSSRNYCYGYGFATGNIEQGKTVEGVKNIQNLITRLDDISNLPFLFAIKNIFLDASEPRKALKSIIG